MLNNSDFDLFIFSFFCRDKGKCKASVTKLFEHFIISLKGHFICDMFWNIVYFPFATPFIDNSTFGEGGGGGQRKIEKNDKQLI